jgi:hypothetical protein
MTCNYCITFSKVKGSSSATNSFIAECDNFRIEAIRSHEKSEYHRKSEEFTHARSLQAGTSIAEKTIQDLMVLWVLLIIEGLNCEIIVRCSLVAISLAIVSNFIIFIFEGEKKHPQNCLFGKDIFTPKNLRLQDFASRFSKFVWGGCPLTPLANSHP